MGCLYQHTVRALYHLGRKVGRNGKMPKFLRIQITAVYFKGWHWILKIVFCSVIPNIPDNAGRKTRRRTQAFAKRYSFHANAKRDSGKYVFSWILQNFWEYFLTEYFRMTASLVYLWILRSFLQHFFYRAPLRNCLFHVQFAVFQPADTVKNYFTGAIQAFHTKTRSSHSKALIYFKSLKIICEEVNL